MKLLFLIGMMLCGTIFAANQQPAMEYHGMIVQVTAHNLDGSVDVQVLQVEDSFAAMEACDEFENIHDKIIGTIKLMYANGSSLTIEGEDGAHVMDVADAIH